MKNLDIKEQTNFIIAKATLMEAMKGGDEKSQTDAFAAVIDAIEKDVRAMAQSELNEMNMANADSQILANRGIKRVLTSEERKYFNAVIEKGDFTKIAEAFPVTIVEDVLSKIEKEHPILSKVDSRTVAGIMKYIYAKPNAQLAFWGDICEDIKQLILNGFEIANLQAFKLSGFVVMCKGMLELGPDWLAEFIYRTLYEIMSASLEHAIVNGEGPGQKQPVGILKSLVGVVDGVYKDKATIALTELNAESLDGVRAALAEAEMDNGDISVLVHPSTYWAKVRKMQRIQTPEGVWVISTLPNGEEVLTTYAMPKDKLVIGNLKNYFLGIASDIKITEYKETLAIEDLDLYIAKFFGNGTPKDKNAFFVIDISGVAGVAVPALETEAVTEPQA